MIPGTELELRVGAVAHGGHCVARYPDGPGGRVVFVRHALPGERVRAVVTEDAGGSYCRADAVEVLDAAPDRVAAPCPHAGPGRCGGCDWQHVSGAAQRRLKAAVVREQLSRLARIDVEVAVEELPGGLLGWRRRIAYAVDGAGRLGLRRHRSHEVERLPACPLGVPGVGDAAALRRAWPGSVAIEVAADDAGAVAVVEHRDRKRHPVAGPRRLRYRVRGRDYRVAAGGFWQVHPHAADRFAAAVLSGLGPARGEVALDLYAGAGLFTALLAEAVGPTGSVLGVEGNPRAARDAAANVADLPWASVRHGRITGRLVRELGVAPDLVVLDPPRTGAGRDVLAAVLGLAPRAVGYVACDPAALARDLRTALDAGWRLAGLRAFDAFPMTHHVECVAVLAPG